MIKPSILAFALTAFTVSGALAAGDKSYTLSKDKAVTSVTQSSAHYSPPQLTHKTVIFSNVGTKYPKGLYFCCYGDTISGPNAGVGGTFSAALQFTPSADVKVTEIDAGVAWVQGVNAVDIVLYDDNGGVPGNVIKSAKATGLGSFGDCCTMAVANLRASLKGGTPYWVAVQADPDGSNTWAAWAFNSTDQIDILTAAYNSGTGWSAGLALPAPSFQVLGR
jgi:hypothetical protein